MPAYKYLSRGTYKPRYLDWVPIYMACVSGWLGVSRDNLSPGTKVKILKPSFLVPKTNSHGVNRGVDSTVFGVHAKMSF